MPVDFCRHLPGKTLRNVCLCHRAVYQCESPGGNGRLWKRCSLPSITPGASPLPGLRTSETEMSTAPWRRMVRVCSYADHWNTFLALALLGLGIRIKSQVLGLGLWLDYKDQG